LIGVFSLTNFTLRIDREFTETFDKDLEMEGYRSLIAWSLNEFELFRRPNVSELIVMPTALSGASGLLFNVGQQAKERYF
jgi:hypothetical protein